MDVYNKESSRKLLLSSFLSGGFKINAHSNLSDSEDEDPINSGSSGRINADDDESRKSSGYCSLWEYDQSSSSSTETRARRFSNGRARKMMVNY